MEYGLRFWFLRASAIEWSYYDNPRRGNIEKHID